MGSEMTKFSAGPMNLGVESQQMQLLAQLLLDLDSYNMTAGIQKGLGPRYGMSTIQGQADSEIPTGTRLPGLRGSEAPAVSVYYGDRTRVFGVVPISLQDPISNEQTTYFAFIMAAGTTTNYFEIQLASTTPSGGFERVSPNIYDGFAIASSDTTDVSPDQTIYGECIVPDADGNRSTPLQGYLAYPSFTIPKSTYISTVAATVSNGTIPMKWFMGLAKTTGDATHAPNVALQKIPGMTPSSGNSGTFTTPAGIPSEYNLASYRTTPRRVKVYTLTFAGAYNIEYSLYFTPSSTNTTPDKTGQNTTVLDFSAITANKDSAGTTYSSSKMALMNDESCLTDSSYQAILVAQQQPLACFFQSPYQQTRGRFNQWIDLTQHSFDPTPAGVYFEDGIAVPCCFLNFPEFVRGTPLVPSFIDGNGIALGDANTGVLRANTVYEFTYSLYNKRLNYETNVGKSVKIQTGDVDFVSLQLFAPIDGSDTLYESYVTGSGRYMPYQFSNWTDVGTATPPSYTGTNNFINFYDYRFYFRAEGTFEWLPAFTIEASQFWFRPKYNLVACTGALAATTGGQPGAFNDYSPLSKDQYVDVKVFNNRAFWCSPKSISFSLQKNFLAYAGRNSVACPQGFFRGMITHAYPGQAQQSSRIVVFGSEQTYVGRFSGNRAQTSVQVSPTDSGVFDVEGSDFTLDPWTSITSFSGRSAVSADGILYYWGPQGVYMDNGVDIPTKISGPLEPDIFNFYDTGRTDEIHCVYNPTTKEITWFYPPPNSMITHSLIFNVDSGMFNRGRFSSQVDWSQNLNLDMTGSTNGKRILIGERSNSMSVTPQRAYFFDYKNRSGDMAPKTDFVVKTVTYPTTSTRQLVLAAGYDATNFATIAIGDYVALQQVTSYSTLASDNLIAQITAIDHDAGTLIFALPIGATLANGSLNYNQYFPIWFGKADGTGMNQIPYQLKTNYWAPAGINGYFFWLYAYLLSKVNLWKTDLTTGLNPSLGYRTPTALTVLFDQLQLEDNSDGNWQLYHPLAPGDDNQEGQAIRFLITGSQLGHEWVLQYLEAHARSIEFDGDPLKRFEG